MMEIDNIVSQDSLWVLMKIAYMVAYGLYAAFAFVVVAQVKQMARTIDAGMNGTLVTIARVHMLIAAGLFVAALIIL